MKLQHKVTDPIITNRWVDVAYGILWSIYAMWGVLVFFAGLPTIASQSPGWYEPVWSVFIATLSALAAISAFSLFVRVPGFDQVKKKTIELGTVIALTAFVAIYPILLVTAAFGGDQTRAANAILAFSYLVFPILRVYMLRQRIKSYKLAQKELQPNGIN